LSSCTLALQYNDVVVLQNFLNSLSISCVIIRNITG